MTWVALAGFVIAQSVWATGSATEYRSRLGFTVTLPPNWFALVPSIVSDASVKAESHPALSNVDPADLRVALDRIRSGEYEYCFRESPSKGFAENLTIRRRTLRIVDDPKLMRQQCEKVPESFSRAFGRPVAVSICELRTVADRPATHLELEGALEGTWSLQYQIRESPETAIAVTATVRSENLATARSEFELIMTSIRFVNEP
jgi:hypothetical protein